MEGVKKESMEKTAVNLFFKTFPNSNGVLKSDVINWYKKEIDVCKRRKLKL
jgi:hypothetical protein|tara:strand:- start:128 stop:280 length:153 start_codon:yes stop_codon:yes gene_type:complete